MNRGSTFCQPPRRISAAVVHATPDVERRAIDKCRTWSMI